MPPGDNQPQQSATGNLMSDPQFLGLDIEGKRKVLTALSPDFAGMDRGNQNNALFEIQGHIAHANEVAQQPAIDRAMHPEEPSAITRFAAGAARTLGMPQELPTTAGDWARMGARALIPPGASALVGSGQAVAQDYPAAFQEGREALTNVAQGQPIVPNTGKMVAGLYRGATAPGAGVGTQLPFSAGTQIQQGNVAGGLGELAPAVYGLRAFLEPAAKPGITPEAAAAKLDAVLPAKGKTVTADIATPELAQRLRETASRMGGLPDNPNPATALRQVVDQAVTENQTTFHKYLDPVAEQPAKVPDMAPGVRLKLQSIVRQIDPALAKRMQDGTTTIGDLNTLRWKYVNAMTRGDFNPGPIYDAPMKGAMKDLGGALRTQVYGQVEQLHNLPADSLRNLKLEEGQLDELKPLVTQKEATLSKAINREASQTKIQKAYKVIGGTRATVAAGLGATAGGIVGGPVGALAGGAAGGAVGRLIAEPGSIADASRLIGSVFTDLPAAQPHGAALPPPRTNLPEGPPAPTFHQRPPAGLLPPPPQGQVGPIPLHGAPDISGTPIEPEYLPPAADFSTSFTRKGKLLPERTGGIELPADEEEAMQVLRANSRVIRDPRTGRMRRIYVTSPK